MALAALAEDKPAAGASGRPNIVLITTDDQTSESLRVMDRTRRLIGAQGVEFKRYFASFPLCCPARATYITGQYAHNHGVLANLAELGGGYPALRDPDHVLPVWLRDAGYDTALIGKWLHAYASTGNPPGWETFNALVIGTLTRYYGYQLTDSRGGVIPFGNAETDYLTDTLTNRFAVPYLRSRAGDPNPFFLHVSYTAPHWGEGRPDAAGRRCAAPQPFRFNTARPKPPLRYADAFVHEPLPMPPSFNERRIGDKPAAASLRRIGRATRRSLAKRYRCELAALLAVDDGVARIIRELERSGLADRTIVIFTSDNGLMHGEHRIAGGKVQPYEEAVRVPMLIRGPGFRPGTRSFKPVADVDLAPTILQLTGASPSGRVPDGRPLSRTLRSTGARNRAILLEGRRAPAVAPDGGYGVGSWLGVRTRRFTYVEYHRARTATAEAANAAPIGAGPRAGRELYDNKLDPYQLRNRVHSARYARPRHTLARLLERLRSCEGSGCLIEAPTPPPGRRRG